MSEDNVTDVPVSAERLLAAMLTILDGVNVPVNVLISDFSNKQIVVEQVEDEVVSFRLADIDEAS